jgi:hypothetical protein
MAKNTLELREELRPRAFPADVIGGVRKVHLVQTPSDRIRDTLYEAGRIMYGLVPDERFQLFVGDVMHDLAVRAEQTLCGLHGVEADHEPLRVLADRKKA